MAMEQPVKRLLAQTVDHAAEHDPERLFAVISTGPELSDGFHRLTMNDMAQAVNSLCWWIERNIGASQPRETLAYMGGSDARYCIFLLACQKTGHQAFFPSTRNSDDAHCYLLGATQCSKFFFTEERSSHALKTQRLCPTVQTLQVPTMKTIFADESRLHPYRCEKLYFDVEDNVTCIIHSSGTTGMPKPVPLTNGFFMCLDALPRLHWPENRQPAPFFDLDQRDLVLATTPFFHLMGLISFSFSIFHRVPVLIGPEKPLSVNHLTKLMQMCKPTAAVFAPSILAELSQSDEALACLKNMKKVQFGGAPLPREVGDRVRKYTQVISNLGSSEVGYLPTLVPEDEANWDYLEWNPCYGIDMQYRGGGLYEMVIPRHQHSREFQGIFHTFPERDVYHTKDLFVQHPSNPRLWKFSGRQDDVIVLSNGEKFNPTTMEAILEGHPLISRALVVGQSRFQAALLVEPTRETPEMSSSAFIEEIWPTVQAANQTVAAHGRVMKSKIGFATKKKPFQRTPKGTTQRRAVIRDYEKEIGAIYEHGLEEDLASYLPQSLDRASILEFVRQTIARTLEGPNIPVDKDIYVAGLDSLMTIQVAKLLQKGLQACRPALKPGIIKPQTIYANPTVEKLAQFIHGILKGEVQAAVPREEKLRRLVEKHTSDFPIRRNETLFDGPSSPSIVILTGSTGSLGTYLLHSLLNTRSISKIYCLNRSDAESRQKKGMEEKGLCVAPDDWTTRVQFLQAAFGEPRFGLDEAKYRELVDSVDTVIHNAWKVDFNYAVESFEETHIQGVRRFVELSLESRHNAHIHFVSSISTVGGWTARMGSSVPELPMEDSAVVLPQGYGESKHVAERICLEASRRSRVPSTIYRVGQIAGPTSSSGQWNPHEWLPTIIATSKAMGKIPTTLGSMPVDWVSVNDLATIMTEIIHARHGDRSPSPSAVFHLNNPERRPWSSLIPAIQERYAVEPVTFRAWIAELESIQNPSSADVAEKPALKLLGFYRGLNEESQAAMSVVLDVQQARQASTRMKTLGPIAAPMMANWLRQWKF